jgi:hypothetical protein
MQSEREGDLSLVANVEEKTTTAHAVAPSSGDTSINEGEGGGRGLAPSISSTAATSAILTIAKGDHRDQRQRDEFGDEDDVVTTTWSVNIFPARFVNVVWHPRRWCSSTSPLITSYVDSMVKFMRNGPGGTRQKDANVSI